MFSKKTRLLQRRQIYSLIDNPFNVGDIWYLVCSKWCRKWTEYVSAKSDATSPGEINNAPLFKEGTNQLRPQMSEDIDFTLVPEEAWNVLVKWYSLTEGQEPIARKVIDIGVFNRNCSVEVYLIDLKLCHNDNLDACLTEYFCRTSTLEQVEAVMRKWFNVLDATEVRLWKKSKTNTYELLTKLEDTLFNANVNAGQVIVIAKKNSDGTWPKETTFGHSDSADHSYSDNRDSSHGTLGLCGLANLGSTCFMNSAIQCLSNVSRLTEYLFSGHWQRALSAGSSHGVALTTAYTILIETLWSGKHKVFEPHEFHAAVGSLQPKFLDGEPHDSQELLTFLLDGLHLELNQGQQMPQCEENLPDAWQDFLQKNKSVIVDLFYGQLKSTLVCSECSERSEQFEAFSCLTLPLPPVEKERQLTIFFVSANPKVKTRQFRVIVPTTGVMNDLRQSVSALSGAPHDQLVVANVYDHRFHKFYSNELLSQLTDRGDIFLFEVPVKSIRDPDSMVIPVYWREIRVSEELGDTGYSQLFGQPLLVSFRKTNCSFNLMYSTLLDHMTRFLHRLEEIPTRMDEDNGENNPLENPGYKDNEMESNRPSPEIKRNRLFTLKLVNSYGSTEYRSISDDDIPFIFSSNAYIATDWSSEDKNHFYNEKEAEEFAVDETMTQMPSEENVTLLSDCIERFTAIEELEWECSKCKMKRPATKKFDILTLPNILVLNLNRFSHSPTGINKLDTYVEYPLRDLNLTCFVENQEPAIFNLIAVSSHTDEMGGHYITHAKHRHTSEWIYFDDSRVFQSSEESVLTKSGYLFLYERQAERTSELSSSKPSSSGDIVAIDKATDLSVLAGNIIDMD